jgi:diguanylate cyclase (GGDEF)-like protein
VPLVVGEDVVGVLSMQSHEPNAFDSGQIRLIETIALQVAVAIQNSQTYEQAQQEIAQRRQAEDSLRDANARLYAYLVEIETLQAKLREQAVRDPLTKLYNRRYLEEALDRDIARALRDGTPLSLVMIDIDRFKDVNDAHGHEAGDVMLRALSKLLQERIRQGDIACRYGGEEFVVVLSGASSAEIVERAEEWREAFNVLRVSFGGHAVSATISLGVASFPDHASMGDDLLRAADKALYQAKAAGRNCTVVHRCDSAEPQKAPGILSILDPGEEDTRQRGLTAADPTG